MRIAPTVPSLDIQEDKPTYIPSVGSDSDRRFAVRQLQQKVVDQGREILKLKRQLAELQAGTQGPPGKTGKPGRDGRDGKDGVDGRDGRDVPTKSIRLIITRDGKETQRVDVPLDKVTKVVEVPLESTTKR